MKDVYFDDVWNELKNEDSDSKVIFETAEEISRIIVELIETRVDRGYSQRQLAAKCGLKQSAIARMESLKTIPRLDTVIRVANALDVVITVNRVTAHIDDLSEYMSTYDSNDNSYSINYESFNFLYLGEQNELTS